MHFIHKLHHIQKLQSASGAKIKDTKQQKHLLSIVFFQLLTSERNLFTSKHNVVVVFLHQHEKIIIFVRKFQRLSRFFAHISVICGPILMIFNRKLLESMCDIIIEDLDPKDIWGLQKIDFNRQTDRQTDIA